MVDTKHGLEYNSHRENLTISEYGRHVQKLIKHCKTIENKEERQEFAEAIIDLMHQMNPMNKNVAEYRLRLWRHMFHIADYELDVTAPDEVSTTREDAKDDTVRMPYPQSEFRFRHYGNTIQIMVRKAVEMEDEEMKQEFTEVIASYMKLAYRTWNREHYVNDEIIKGDLKSLSKGKLELAEDYVIGNIAPSRKNTGRSSGRGRSNSNNRNNRNKNNKNNNRRKRH